MVGLAALDGMDTRRTETPASDLRGLARPPEIRSADQRSIGLLIVHGIGEQAEGETARKLIDGLRHVYGSNHVDDRGENPISVTITGSERTVRLYEVYWADVLSGKAEGSFDIKTLSSLPWLPHYNLRAGFFGDTPPTRFSFLVGGAFFHLLSACVYFGYYGSHALTILWLTASGTIPRPLRPAPPSLWNPAQRRCARLPPNSHRLLARSWFLHSSIQTSGSKCCCVTR